MCFKIFQQLNTVLLINKLFEFSTPGSSLINIFIVMRDNSIADTFCAAWLDVMVKIRIKLDF